MRKLLLAALLASPALPAGAAGRLAGAEFLTQPHDVRSRGMGETGQASASGAGGMTVNPAAVHDISKYEAYFTHSQLAAGIGADHGAFGLASGRHRLAASLTHVGYGTLSGRDDNGNPTGGFSPSDDAYSFTYGTTIGPVETAGTIKRVQSRIVSTARTTAFDVGGRYRVADDWSVGASAVNIGKGLKFDALEDPLPARAAAGAAWKTTEDWTLALDVNVPFHAPTWAAIGSEYRFKTDEVTSFFFRAGLNTRTPEAGRFAGLKAGVGARFRAVGVDYSFAPGGDAGDAHLISLTWRFGTPDGEKGPRER